MRRAAWLLFLLLGAGLAQRPMGPSNQDLATVEANFDDKLRKTFVDTQFQVIDRTNGVYIEGSGVVFTNTVNLTMTPVLSPFFQSISPAEKEKFQQQKVKKLPVLRQFMKDFLVTTATSIDKLPADESVTLSVKMFYQSWELHQGLPERVVVTGQKRKLVDIAANRLDRSKIDTVVRTRELY
jgi:hypothetical protein